MRFKQVISAAAVAALAITSACAQDNTKVKPAAPADAPAQPKFVAENLLKLIPEELGEYTVDGKVVKVNSKDVKLAFKGQLEMAAAQGADITADMIKQSIPRMAESAVMQQIIGLEATKKGIKPDLDGLRKELANFKSGQLQGKEDAFKRFLESQGCKTEEELIAKIAPQQLIQQFVKSVQDSIVISDQAVKDYYDKHAEDHTFYTCSHILAAFNPENPRGKATPEQEAAALKKIQDIQARLAKGESFEKLAKELSDCPSGKQADGKLQDYNPEKKIPEGQMVPEFTKAFNALKPGEMTKAPVKTQFGYHVIKASPVVVRSLEDETPQIKEMLRDEEMQKKVPALIEQLKKDYKVVLYPVK